MRVKPLNNELHVWKIPLICGESDLVIFKSILSNTEREQAARFHQDLHRRRYIVRRAAYRIILGNYLGTSPAKLSWRQNEYGKPDLGIADMAHNASHSHELAVLVVSAGASVGVDIERIRDFEPPLNALTATERAMLESAPAARRSLKFLAYWVSKEAYLKARGVGLSVSPDSISIPIRSQGASEWRDTNGQWSLCEIDVGSEYLAALVYAGSEPGIVTLDWDMSQALSELRNTL